MKITLVFTLLLYILRGNSGYSIPKLEDRNSSDIYEVQENNKTAIKIINPKPTKQTLREITYYHIIERPYEESQDVPKFREAEGSGPVYDETTRPFTNGHGFQFVEPDAPTPVALETEEVSKEEPIEEEKIALESEEDLKDEAGAVDAADGAEEPIEGEGTLYEEEFPEYETGLEGGEEITEVDESTELPAEYDVMTERKAARNNLFDHNRRRYKKAITPALRRNKRDNPAGRAFTNSHGYQYFSPKRGPIGQKRDYINIPAPPTLPPLNYDALPGYVRALISTEKPRTAALSPNKENASNFGTKIATQRIKPMQEPKSTGTYGMSLRNDRGRIWNNLWTKAKDNENNKYENPEVIERPDLTEAKVYLSKPLKRSEFYEETTTESNYKERDEEKASQDRRYEGKNVIEQRLKDIFATLKPFQEEDEPKKLRTYGMRMANGEAHVWNNLWSTPGRSIDFDGMVTGYKKEELITEKPKTVSKEVNESEKQDTNETIEPKNIQYKEVNDNIPDYNEVMNPNTHENDDILVKVNKIEEHTKSSPIEKTAATVLQDEQSQRVPNHKLGIEDFNNKSTSKLYESKNLENFTKGQSEVESNVETTTESKHEEKSDEDARYDAKRVIQNRLDNIFATFKPFIETEDKPKKSRTYGMSIINGEAHVWNNLWNNPVSSIDFGGIETGNKNEEHITETPEKVHEEEKESERESEQHNANETIEPEIKPYNKVNENIKPDENYDIFVNVNKKEKHTTSSPIDTIAATTLLIEKLVPNNKLNIQDINDFNNKATTYETTTDAPNTEFNEENENIHPKSAIDQRKKDMIAGIMEFRDVDGEYKPRTYGMVLRGNHGRVWNNIFTNPEVSFDVGEPEYYVEDYKEENGSITSMPDLIEIQDDTATPKIPEENINKESGDEIQNQEDKIPTDKPDISPNKDTSSETLPDEKNEESKTPEEKEENVKTNKSEVDKKPDAFEDLMKNEEFWKWLADWTSTYMELLTKQIAKTVNEEVEKQTKELFDEYIKKLNEAKLELFKDKNEDPSITDPTEPAIKDNKLIFDGKEIPITNTSNIEEDKGDKDEELLKNRKDKDRHSTHPAHQVETNTNCKNDTTGPPINIKNEDIHGNTIGNITNIYIFYPNKDVNEIIKDLNQTNGNINISGNGSIVKETHLESMKEEQTEKLKETTTAVPTKPEATPASPEVTPATPEVTPSSPEVTTPTPEMTPATPEVTPASPEVTTLTLEVTAATPEVTATTPEATPASPEVNPATPEVTPSTPEATSASPEVTSATSASPEVTSATSASPEVTSATSASPEVTSTISEATSASPEVSSATSEATSATPADASETPEVIPVEMTAVTSEVTPAPEVTSASSEATSASPEGTSASPELTPVTPEVTSNPETPAVSTSRR